MAERLLVSAMRRNLEPSLVSSNQRAHVSRIVMVRYFYKDEHVNYLKVDFPIEISTQVTNSLGLEQTLSEHSLIKYPWFRASRSFGST